MKAAKGRCWDGLLHVLVVYNMNHGPFKSGQWFRAKQENLTDILELHDHTYPPFQEILVPFATRLGLPYATPQQRQDVFLCRGGIRNATKCGHVWN